MPAAWELKEVPQAPAAPGMGGSGPTAGASVPDSAGGPTTRPDRYSCLPPLRPPGLVLPAARGEEGPGLWRRLAATQACCLRPRLSPQALREWGQAWQSYRALGRHSRAAPGRMHRLGMG